MCREVAVTCSATAATAAAAAAAADATRLPAAGAAAVKMGGAECLNARVQIVRMGGGGRGRTRRKTRRREGSEGRGDGRMPKVNVGTHSALGAVLDRTFCQKQHSQQQLRRHGAHAHGNG
jgi:hypothetical protein